jgi:hypothetical protein
MAAVNVLKRASSDNLTSFESPEKKKIRLDLTTDEMMEIESLDSYETILHQEDSPLLNMLPELLQMCLDFIVEPEDLCALKSTCKEMHSLVQPRIHKWVHSHCRYMNFHKFYRYMELEDNFLIHDDFDHIHVHAHVQPHTLQHTSPIEFLKINSCLTKLDLAFIPWFQDPVTFLRNCPYVRGLPAGFRAVCSRTSRSFVNVEIVSSKYII